MLILPKCSESYLNTSVILQLEIGFNFNEAWYSQRTTTTFRVVVTPVVTVSEKQIKSWEENSSPTPGFWKTCEVWHPPTFCAQELSLLICHQKEDTLDYHCWQHLSHLFLGIKDILFVAMLQEQDPSLH